MMIRVQWDYSNLDTGGIEESVHYWCEVSLFQGLKLHARIAFGESKGVLPRAVSFGEWFHCSKDVEDGLVIGM